MAGAMPANLRQTTLEDKYITESGRVFLSGAQALARLPMIQRRLDREAGLNTAGYISGYRGSPLGHLDMTLWSISERLAANHIVFQPGVNEELAATAVFGTQQLALLPDQTYDGVFAMWYGKGPGVDRSMDAFKHGNYAGSHPHGGVLLVYGDDHPGKSSTVSHQSEHALAAQLVPSLYPASVKEFFRFGLLGWAMSRYSGASVGLKAVNETMEQTATCEIQLDGFGVKIPDTGRDSEIHNRGSLVSRIDNERIAYEDRLDRVRAFVRANGIDEVLLATEAPRLGIVAAGKSAMDVLQALELLGVDEGSAARYRVSLYKVGCIWPLEPTGVRTFSHGLAEICVVEEKKPFIEPQLALQLINERDRPVLTGKTAPDGSRQFSSVVPLSPREIAIVLAARLDALGLADDSLRNRAAALGTVPGSALPPGAARLPFFCSGCPHNRSTRIPEGSRAMVGTGCATMEVFFRPDRIVPAQMGGEGANWLGLAPFTKTQHIFQNLGDGTYFHSGLMSIRAAVAAKANITFKILYNDAVAMTGGQPVDGRLSTYDIARQVLSEGVARCVIVAEDPSPYRGNAQLPAGVDVYHRDALDRVQRELRDVEGCTVLIYEQTCAAEKRRRRKRGRLPDPDKRLFIYEPVCEGCGDCSKQSNCVSIHPLETPFGLKRQVDQFSCNKDYSCSHGFCPSFVTVKGARPRKGENLLGGSSLIADLPEPRIASTDGRSYNVMIAGIGGTGVVTVGAVLGMAAHLEQRACSVFDMTGLAQKNGAVYSHLKVAEDESRIPTSAISAGAADLVLAFDLVAATGDESFRTVDAKRTRLVGDRRIAPLPTFQVDQSALIDDQQVSGRIRERLPADRFHLLDARGLASAVCGDAIMSNFLLLGYAAQLGVLPVSVTAIQRAIELNGVAVKANSQAFDVGRLAAHDRSMLDTLAGMAPESPMPRSVDEIVAHRSDHLTAYQDPALARKYRAAVEMVSDKERERTPGMSGLAEAVAENYARVLAYKDEYEVARLYAGPEFKARLEAAFDGEIRLRFNLAPPLMSRADKLTGRPAKREFGPWILPAFGVLARLRWLRGTRFDPFGCTAERRLERQLISDYEEWMREVIDVLTPETHAVAVDLLGLPRTIVGFGPVKAKNLSNAMARAVHLRTRLRG